MSKNSGLRTARDDIMANMSAQIVREIVASSLKIKATNVILSSVLPENFCVEAVSTSGCMYSNSNDCRVWAFNPQQGLVLLQQSVITENAASNANGTWENSYGYTFEMLAEQAPEAIFFVVMESSDYSDCNGRDEHSISYTLYKAPDFKSHWAKIQQEAIARWEQWLNS
jgi:hypothetical protein